MTLLSEASFLVTPNGYKASKLYAAIPTNGNGDMTVTRATTATRVDENDLVSSVASNVPRIDYTGGGCPSILLEPQRTNSIRNSTMQGANVSTNTFPNFWYAGGNGLTAQLVGLGVENGLNYIDVNYNGVAVQASVQFSFDTNTVTNAIVGQTWSLSVYMKTISATLPPNSYRIQINEFSSAGSYLTGNQLVISPTTEIQRFSQTRTNTSATCAFVQSYYYFPLTIGNSYNFTIRIYAPQLELGAYATSYIPTTTATVTRNADVLSRDNIYTNNLIVGGGGTWFVHLINNTALIRDIFYYSVFLGTGSTGDASANALTFTFGGSTAARATIRKKVSSVEATLYSTTTDTAKILFKWNGASADVFVNGAKVVSATLFNTTAMEHLGASGNDTIKYIKQMALFARPLTDAQCIALTTL